MISVGELISKKQIKIELEMEMKKYMTPEMEVIDIKVQGMLCISGEGSTPGDGGIGDDIDE